MTDCFLPVSPLVLAAGLSRRMGSFKLLLAWGERTVIEQVVTTLTESGLRGTTVVSGYRAEEVARALAAAPVRLVFNPRYTDGEMISSIQAGLAALAEDEHVKAALVCLGDQPQMRAETVLAVVNAGTAASWNRIIVPSYQMRAGHPILLPRWLWAEVIAAHTHLNAVLKAHKDETVYVAVETPTVLADIDTQEDYAQARPGRSAADRD